MKEVEKVYKENSTKGGSLINPVSYKGDVMVQVWMDSRVLATLCKWMEGEGEYPRFLSHVVRMPLEMLADRMVDEGRVEMVDDTSDARALLEGRFHVMLNKGRKGMKNLLHNTVLSSKRGTDLEKGGPIDYTRHEVEPIKEGFEEQRDRWRKEQIAKKQELKEITEKETQKAIVGGLVVKDDGTPLEKNREEKLTDLVETYHKIETGENVSVKEGMSEEEFMERAKERDLARTKLENAPFEASDLPIV